MSRRIIFKGKPLNDDPGHEGFRTTWVYGGVSFIDDNGPETRVFITHQLDLEESSITVEVQIHQDSLCQFTGMLDGHENLIYEKDVLKIAGELGEVVYDNTSGGFKWRDSHGELYGITSGDKANRVVGNTVEWPEMISK